MENKDLLSLSAQPCFPLYACAREVIKLYTPLLSPIGLTYTQYIAMLVLWEEEEISAGEMGKRLYLDSGTMTPVLKSLEKKGYLRRHRNAKDERVLMVSLTEAGRELRKKAEDIPWKLADLGSPLSPEEAKQLHHILYKLLDALQEN